LIFRDVLKDRFLAQIGLGSAQSFAIIFSLLILTFGVASIGIFAWLVGRTTHPKAPIPGFALGLLAGLAALVLAAKVYIGAIARPDPYPIPAKDAQARFPESKETRVNSFTYQAADPTNAGPRYWRRSVSGDGWVERTPAGDESFFQIDKRTNYGGCDGTVVSKIGEPNFQLLIPDRGCPNMELKFRRSTNENWMGLPRMENIL